MSERMNKERAIELLKTLIEYFDTEEEVARRKSETVKLWGNFGTEYSQALDIAIESLEQENKKRDH